jgi:two-component system cell cycle sensor histidine kinase/response regulator CckA
MKSMLTVFMNVTFFFLWAMSLGCLAFFADNTVQWGGILSLALLSIVTGGVFWRLNQKMAHLKSQLTLARAITQGISQNHELVAFNEQGQTVYSTHPHLYPTQKEFLRKLMARVNPCSEALVYKQWLEEHHKGEVLVMGGGNGLGLQQRWWLANTIPLDPVLLGGADYQMAILTEVTRYLDGYHQLKQNYTQIETFLDYAPFGLFYLNRTHHIVGVNGTFAKWMCMDREKLMGNVFLEFVEGADPGILTAHLMRVVTIKPLKSPAFKALWIPPQDSSKVQASLLVRLDSINLSLAPSKEDYLSEPSFIQAAIPAVVIEKSGKILAFNPSFGATMGDSATFEQGRFKIGDSLFDMIHSSIRSEVVPRLERMADKQAPIAPFEFCFEGGKTFTTAFVSRLESPLEPVETAPLMIQFIDISEQKRLEQQFIQSQKMQAVGQLAGGIAHDFNNLLTAMIGFCDLLLQRFMPNDPSYTDIVQIKQNANRAANLVRQLLAFSRQQNLQPKVVSVTDTLAELSALLRRLIGAGIELQVVHGRDLWPVKVDPGQLEQVIINLAVNARDAMNTGGALVIRTGHYQCHRQHRVGHDMMPPGDYVLIEVIDTGHGIDPRHIEHIFEPFFSTKEIGSGTGLGLSTVYGIVKQTGGFVSVESELSKGTTFKIFLPRYVGSEPVFTTHTDLPAGDLTGVETILLVEDEDPVRLFSARALREKGYQVLEANSGEAALDIIKDLVAKDEDTLDLLVTDVVMPKMDGPTLSKKVRDLMPGLKTIFISGYTEDTFRRNLDDDSHIHFLAKPFTLKDLAAKVKEVLQNTNKEQGG